MSKRNVAILGLVMLLTLSAMAFAMVPSAPDAPAGEDTTTIASLRMLDLSHALYDPACPPPGPPSCGGGG